MSGGHFYPEYVYHKINSFADEVEEALNKNGTKRGEYFYGEEYHPTHEPEVIEYIRSQLPQMRKMAEIMRHIDYLYAGDHGDDSFLKRVKEVEDKYG